MGKSSTVVKRTQSELVDELRRRFGPSEHDWAFVCPMCGDVATARDIRQALDTVGRTEEHSSAHLGQICIGRILGALKRDQPKGGYNGRGCDWAAFGLFQGPEFVILPGGREVPCFAIAEARP